MGIAYRYARVRCAFFVMASLVMAACSERAAPTGAVTVSETDSSGATLVAISGDVTTLPLWELSPEPLLEIRGDRPPYFGSIGEVQILSDGRLLVEDNQSGELWLFSANGAAERLVGRAGEGPGEFSNVAALTVTPGDTAYAFDRRLARISVFDPSGTLIRTLAVLREDGGIGTVAHAAWGLDSEHLLLHRRGLYHAASAAELPRHDQRDVTLYLLDGQARNVKGPVVFPGGYSIESDWGDGLAPFANRPIVAASYGRIVHGSGIVYELVVRDAELELERIIRWSDWPRESLTDEAIQQAHDEVLKSFGALATSRSDLVAPIMEDLFSPSVLPTTLPALGSAIVEAGGEVWVSRFTPRTSVWDQAGFWHVLDSAGHPMGRVRLPPDSRLAAVRGNRIAVVSRDSLAVEHFSVLNLVRRGR